MLALAAFDAAGDVDLRFQLVGLILYLLAVLFERAAHEHRARDLSGRRFSEERFFVAETDVHARDHGSAAGLLGEHHELQAVGKRGADDAALDVLGVGSNSSPCCMRRVAFVIFEQLGVIGRGGDYGAVGAWSG